MVSSTSAGCEDASACASRPLALAGKEVRLVLASCWMLWIVHWLGRVVLYHSYDRLAVRNSSPRDCCLFVTEHAGQCRRRMASRGAL